MTQYAVELEIPPDCHIDGIQPGTTTTIDVGADEYVLAAARGQGIWLPADCQQGWCTTCAGELLEGSIDQSAAKRYYPVDAETDLILLCTAKPESDLRIRVCQYERMLDHRAEHDLPPGRAKRS